MTPTQYKAMWDTFQVQQEKKYAAIFRKALREQVDVYLRDGIIPAAPMHAALVDLYRNCGAWWAYKTGLHKLKRKQNKARLPMGFSERIVELMRQYYGAEFFLNEANLIDDYTRQVIQTILDKAAITGVSIDEIETQIRTSSELGAMRARRIARTETVTAANKAGLVNARDTGVPMNKIWLSVNDRRTRHSHLNVDNVTVPLDSYFNVGGATMQNPGDRTQESGLAVPAKEIINCRCTLGYKVVK